MASLLQRIGLVGGGIVLLVALVANAALGVGAVSQLVQGHEDTFRAQRLGRRISLLRYALSDAETGQRGYLLTGAARYLEPYTASSRLASVTIDSLEALSRVYPTQAARMPAIRILTREKLDELAVSVALARTGNRAEALALVDAGRGQEIMDSLRVALEAMEEDANQMRDRQRDLSITRSRRIVQAQVISNGALFLLVGLFGWRLRRDLRQRERASADLRAANAALGQALVERETALANVHAMQAQMVQQEKLAGLGRLTAGVAHELKNPLNFVNNFAQLAHEMSGELQAALDGGNADEARALLADLRLNTSKVLKHGQRADDIVRTMLVHARGVSGDRQKVDLDAVLEQAVTQAIGPGDLRAVEIVRRDGPSGLEAWGVPTALTRLFLNLLENAVQAVRERAGLVPDADYTPTVWLGVRRGFDRAGQAVALVTVEDNGPGIAETALPRIFEPFYTTKAPGQGTGLGLSLAYDIAVGHGGTLAAGRARGGGACFTVTLPLDAPPVPAEASTADASAVTAAA